ncbi:MAG: preprotein translocase subunit SecG [Candidatus Eremiobacteraeota bacterium]|nr:preprotein translocase subunit SecG [Candidatus Eremiobacteraeota bacterium]MBV8434587.1 preprotein translocase subunit SecG [Candidatus Eremiobacteraeota bacterium]MBV8583639.1 preprotein translocase subunit SecG [Candidatus Eremiobacteraeota bacterium]MBV8722702.1 preprotein translocase subunit SecG [Candidatus Eremiobacteraeota bacterium]
MFSFVLAASSAGAPPAAANPVAAPPSAGPAGASPLPAQALPPQPLAAPSAAPVQTAVAQHFPWLTHGIAGIFILSAIALVALLAVQTTKQEGLTGSIGGRVESAYRGRLGADEQLKRMTGFVAVVFVVSAFILSLTGI